MMIRILYIGSGLPHPVIPKNAWVTVSSQSRGGNLVVSHLELLRINCLRRSFLSSSHSCYFWFSHVYLFPNIWSSRYLSFESSNFRKNLSEFSAVFFWEGVGWIFQLREVAGWTGGAALSSVALQPAEQLVLALPQKACSANGIQRKVQ